MENMETNNSKINWEERRFELMKVIVSSLVADGWKFSQYPENVNFIIKEVDAILAEYKKKVD